MRRAFAYLSGAALVVIVSGCGHSADSLPDPTAGMMSNHTLQELCDLPKEFYKTEFNADNLSVSLGVGHPMTDKIGVGNGCDYNTIVQDPADRNYLGQISLIHSTDGPSSGIEHLPAKTIVIDNTAIKEAFEANSSDFIVTEPKVTLSVTINGWHGEFNFWGRDDQTITAGGKVLLKMMRTLTN